MENREISKAVITRLPRYYRYLGELLESGVERISSNELSTRMKVTASQIRQVLQNWGRIRYQGFSPEERAQYESFLIRICENVQQYKQGGMTIG